jgi:hypothetical protein
MDQIVGEKFSFLGGTVWTHLSSLRRRLDGSCHGNVSTVAGFDISSPRDSFLVTGTGQPSFGMSWKGCTCDRVARCCNCTIQFVQDKLITEAWLVHLNRATACVLTHLALEIAPPPVKVQKDCQHGLRSTPRQAQTGGLMCIKSI